MKILACTVISLAFSCLLPFSLGQADLFKMSIVEDGTLFSEDIEVKEKEGVEVFHVPAHNDVDGADFYHDFRMRLTITKIPSRRVCYISEMDSALSSPEKLKADLRRVDFQPYQRPVVVKRNLVMVTDPANRNVLTKEILDFCGALPIYNTEVYTDVNNGNGTKAKSNMTCSIKRAIVAKYYPMLGGKECCPSDTGKRGFCAFQRGFKVDRQKRRIIKNFVSCGDFSGVVNCMSQKWNLNCRMKTGTCYYWVKCVNLQPAKDEWKCESKHIRNAFPSCCNYSCP